MYKDIEKFLNNNHKIEDLVLYDFKLQSPWEDVNNEKDNIKRFELYKGKETPTFDCDSCFLADSVYFKLWGWKYRNRFNLSDKLNMLFGEKWDRMGSDTMNSFATTYNRAKRIYGDDLIKLKNNVLLSEFASLTHTVGNFTLVPFLLEPTNTRSFNSSRGFKGNTNNPYFVYDYFDMSLKLIKEHTTKEMFKNYIDTFLLNDYVDGDYNIKPLFKRHNEFLNRPLNTNVNLWFLLPQNEEELNEYLENVNSLIKQRGHRIVDCLKTI